MKSKEQNRREKGKEGAVSTSRAAGEKVIERTAGLTCLCLYSSRQAIMWVDMIADDLLAAVREDTKRRRYVATYNRKITAKT